MLSQASCIADSFSERIGLDAGANAGNTKVKSDDQPGDSVEAELTRVRAKRLTRAERPKYLDNEDFEEEVSHDVIHCCVPVRNFLKQQSST